MGGIPRIVRDCNYGRSSLSPPMSSFVPSLNLKNRSKCDIRFSRKLRVDYPDEYFTVAAMFGSNFRRRKRLNCALAHRPTSVSVASACMGLDVAPRTGNFLQTLAEDDAQFFSVELSPAQRTVSEFARVCALMFPAVKTILPDAVSPPPRLLPRKEKPSTINLTHDTRRPELIYRRLRIRV